MRTSAGTKSTGTASAVRASSGRSPAGSVGDRSGAVRDAQEAPAPGGPVTADAYGVLQRRIGQSPRQVAQARRLAALQPAPSRPPAPVQRFGAGTPLVPEAELEAYFDKLTAKLRKTLTRGFGVTGTRRGLKKRSQEVRDFRSNLKAKAREEAHAEVGEALEQNDEINYETERAYYHIAAKKATYKPAKGSVQTVLAGKVEEVLRDTWTGDKTARIDRAVGAATAGVDDQPSYAKRARSAALRAAKAHLDTEFATQSEEAHAIKQSVVKPEKAFDQGLAAAPPPGMAQGDLEGAVRGQVRTDEVGTRALRKVIEADSVEQGMGLFSKALDQVIPASGDQVAVSVEFRVPVAGGPAYVAFSLSGKAARGIDGAMTAGVPKFGDPRRLEVMFELAFRAGADLIGVDIGGGVKAFVRAGADSTALCMKSMSYGAYRSVAAVSDTAANWWAGRTQGVEEGRTQRAEAWAAMVEEQAFKEGGGYVDLGGGADVSATIKGDAGIAGAEIGVAGGFGVFRHFDADILREAMGDDVFARPVANKRAAQDRRAAAHGRTAGEVAVSGSVKVKIAGQEVEFAGSFSMPIGDPGWGVEVSATITNAGDGPTALEKWGPGCASGVASLLKSLMTAATKAKGGTVVDGGAEALQIVNTSLGSTVTDALAEVWSVEGSQASMALGTAAGTVPDRVAGALASSTLQLAVLIGHDGDHVIVRLELRSGQKLEIKAKAGAAGVTVSAEKTKRIFALGLDDGQVNAEFMGARARKTAAKPGRSAHRT